VLQFRLTQKEERGTTTKLVRPYLLEKDVLRFGYSSREYVLLNADAKK